MDATMHGVSQPPAAWTLTSGFRCRRVDHVADTGHAIGREAALFGVFAHQLFVRGDVDAINLFVGHEAFDPIDFRSEFREDTAGFLRDGVQLLRRALAGTGNFPFDDVFGYGRIG